MRLTECWDINIHINKYIYSTSKRYRVYVQYNLNSVFHHGDTAYVYVTLLGTGPSLCCRN